MGMSTLSVFSDHSDYGDITEELSTSEWCQSKASAKREVDGELNYYDTLRFAGKIQKLVSMINDFLLLCSGHRLSFPAILAKRN